MAGISNLFPSFAARWSRRIALGVAGAGVLAGGVAMALPLARGAGIWEILPFVAQGAGDNPRQMRIQQHIFIRITPGGPPMPPPMMFEPDEDERPVRVEERRMGRCIPASAIAGVQSGTRDRLVLFLRDSRVVTAVLPKSCRANDFYSGFYVDRNADGQLCADRDEIHARSGASCHVDDFRAVVEQPARRKR
jgi:hypothetical protein